MTNATTPQSASETQPRSVKPRIGTPDHLNSDVAVVANPFASPAVKESISFDKALCEFLRLHYHVHEAKAREWMHAARTDQQGDSEALRFSRAVHQAENAHWNQLGQFRGHFAVWHADPLYMRAYEAWPDLTMHERYSRLKMALGPVSTPFNFAGTLDEAVAALEKFILTGEIPKPAPPSPALVAACKNDEISRRSAALEKAFEKPAVVHGPVNVAAQKVAQSGETVVQIQDKADLNKVFPRGEDGQPVEHFSQRPAYHVREQDVKSKWRASAILPAKEWDAWVHKVFGVKSRKEIHFSEDETIDTLEIETELKYSPEKEKPVTQIAETTPAATVAPAKPNDAPAGKAEPQRAQFLSQGEMGCVTTTAVINGFQVKITVGRGESADEVASNIFAALAGLRIVAGHESVKTFGTIADGRDTMTVIKDDGKFLAEPTMQRVSAPMQNAQTGGSTAPAPVSADSGSAACMMVKVGKTYRGDKDQLAFDCEGFEDPLKYSSKDSGAFLKIVTGLRKSDGSAITLADLSQGNKFTVRGKVQWRKSEDGKYTNVVGTEAA